MVEGRSPKRHARIAEGMEIGVAGLTPVVKLDPKLERSLRRANERVLINPQGAVIGPDLRDGGFANPDNADLLGFDEMHLHDAGEHVRERRRGEPAGCPAAHDHHPPDPSCFRHRR